VDFFSELAMQLAELQGDKRVIISIPIWGWTGDGKTCALLTALHYSDLIEHGFNLALVNRIEAGKLGQQVEEYKGYDLAAIAASTSQSFLALSEDFFDKRKWPRGTDNATPYLFKLNGRSRPLGYLFFPDLQGGSFREEDEVAQAVLEHAHGCVILVNPELFVAKTTDGKRYKDSTIGRIFECASRNIPACILITKSDRRTVQHKESDDVRNQLTMLIDGHTELEAKIFQVSVIRDEEPSSSEGRSAHGGTTTHDENPLPPADTRKPDNLIRAFGWVISKALKKSNEEIKQTIPPFHLRQAGESRHNISLNPIAELRALGEYSNSPGRILLVGAPIDGNHKLIFATRLGELSILDFNIDSDAPPGPQPVGVLEGWTAEKDNISELVAHEIAGELLAGHRSGNINYLWCGSKGGLIRRLHLPSVVSSWTPISSKRVAAVDSSGRIHVFTLENSQWNPTAFLADFISPSSAMLCSSIDQGRRILISNGIQVESILILPDGRFGERAIPRLNIANDTQHQTINSLGLFAGLSDNKILFVSVADKQHVLGEMNSSMNWPFAIAQNASSIAFVTSNMQLLAGRVTADGVTLTEPKYSPTLPELPSGMAWTPDGSLLIVSYDAGMWAAFRPVGLGK
jgi:hypothetical protein